MTRVFIAIMAVAVGLGLGYVTDHQFLRDPVTAVRAITTDGDNKTVERVVDGDTLEVSGNVKVRLIGVDTPEVYGKVECYGREASDFTKQFLPVGTAISLEYDKERNDRYGRTLAYVKKTSTGESINAELVKKGFATPLAIKPNTARAAEYESLANQAKQSKAGLWATCPGGSQ